MTSDVNFNAHGQQSGSGIAGSDGKMEQRKQREGEDVKMVLNGLGVQEGRIGKGNAKQAGEQKKSRMKERV